MLAILIIDPFRYMVIGTARKPLIVLLAVAFFGRVISPIAYCGITIAFLGVAW